MPSIFDEAGGKKKPKAKAKPKTKAKAKAPAKPKAKAKPKKKQRAVNPAASVAGTTGAVIGLSVGAVVLDEIL